MSRNDWILAVIFYPFTVGAATINLFMLSLLGTWIGIPSLAPGRIVALALFVALPFTWLAVRWVRRLLDRAAADR